MFPTKSTPAVAPNVSAYKPLDSEYSLVVLSYANDAVFGAVAASNARGPLKVFAHSVELTLVSPIDPAIMSHRGIAVSSVTLLTTAD